ncbi:MAG: O-antigen ligase family protein [Acidobacteriota bacterium]|nr:MAG: O-antigen ligase family protein [Acidobacteriota bacterium]
MPLGSDASAIRLDTRSLFAGLTLLLAALTLASLPRARQPSLGWILATVGLPAWLALQLVPLPAAWSAQLSPRTVELWQRFWPGPVFTCEGPAVLAGDAPSWLPVTIDPSSTWRLLFLAFATMATFLAARSVFGADERARRSLFVVVAGFTAAEAAYGLYQWAAADVRVLWRMKEAYLENATGTLINRNHFALLVYLGLGCTLTLLAARQREARERVGSADSREVGVRATLALLVGLQLAGIVASQSRAGLAGAALVVVPTLPLLLRGAGMVRAVAMAMLAMVAVPAAIFVGPGLLERLAKLPLEWTSPAGRGAVYRASMAIVQDFPLFGSGGGTFEWVFALYRNPEIQGRYDYAHNDHLQLLVETGAIGVLLTLAPAVLVLLDVLRRRRAARPAFGGTWPLAVALLAVVLHEVVDFGLRIPAHALLFGLLAGTVAGGPADAPPRSRSRAGLVVFVGAGVLLAPMAALYSLVGWPGLQDRWRWPQVPEVAHERARRLLQSWREQPVKDDRLACRAIAEEAFAQRGRPVYARYAATQAIVTQTALRAAAAVQRDPDRSELLRSQVSRSCELARQLDPWNPWIRERIMIASLDIGDLDRAAQDARQTARLSDALARRVVDTLRRAGLPPPLIGEIVGDVPSALARLLEAALDAKDSASAAALVPADIAPTPGLCSIGARIRAALAAGHGISAESFLRGCLQLAEVRDDQPVADNVRAWLAQDELRNGEIEAAATLIGEMAAGPGRTRLELEFARTTDDWEAVVSLARQLLGSRAADRDQRYRALLHSWVGEAYAQQRQLSAALREYERALELDPSRIYLQRTIDELRRGNNPHRPRVP